jgi:glycosyltransferase 2 family protein
MSSIWHASPSRSRGSRKFAARSLQSRWRRAPAIVGCAIGGACLVWLARQVSLEQALASVRGLDWSIVALAVAADIGAYIIQGWRWSLLLRPVKRASWLATTEAIYVGLFANEILPLRTGEIIRAYALSRSLRVSVSSIVPSMLVERLFDGIWLGIGVSVTALLVPLPGALRQAADIFAGTILIATSAFAVMVFRSSASASTPPAPSGTISTWAEAARNAVHEAAAGIRQIGLTRTTLGAAGVSLLFLFSQALAFWLVMRACGLSLSPWVAAAVLLIVHLGNVLPSAPANVGTFQMFTVVGLGIFGVERAVATPFSMVLFLVLTIPLWALGGMAVASRGLSIRALRSAAEAESALS